MTFITEDAHEGVVEIHETAFGRRDKNTLLNLFEKRAELVFGLPAAGEVLEDVNRSEASALGIMESGIGGQKVSSEGGIYHLGLSGCAFAVGTANPGNNTTVAKHVANHAPHQGFRFNFETLRERAIGANDAAIQRVNQD